MTNLRRSQSEIVDRIENLDDDMFGFRFEVLVQALDYDYAKPYLKDDVSAAEWDVDRLSDTEKEARNYLAFAIGKIEDERGISAERSVIKLREFAWLLGRDDAVAAMDAADYGWYGDLKVRAFAAALGWPCEINA